MGPDEANEYTTQAAAQTALDDAYNAAVAANSEGYTEYPASVPPYDRL